jgi:NAD(P)-dependent dehydrogenase (short-subunit alcohol dehydrogenase family)
MSSRFSHKVVVITGGSDGIGLAGAKRFVEDGALGVIICGRKKEKMEKAVEGLEVRGDNFKETRKWNKGSCGSVGGERK